MLGNCDERLVSLTMAHHANAEHRQQRHCNERDGGGFGDFDYPEFERLQSTRHSSGGCNDYVIGSAFVSKSAKRKWDVVTGVELWRTPRKINWFETFKEPVGSEVINMERKIVYSPFCSVNSTDFEVIASCMDCLAVPIPAR